MIPKVGITDFHYKKGRKLRKRKFSYLDVAYGKDGWVDAKKYLPADFDLLDLRMPDKILPGWSRGNGWDGLRIKPEHQVVAWRHHELEND